MSVKIVNTGSNLTQDLLSLPMGANNIFQAGVITAQKDAASLNQLTKGGSKRYKKGKYSRYKGGNPRYKGGATTATTAAILAPTVPSYATPGTQGNYNDLAKLNMNTLNQAVFDNATNQSQVANLATQQSNIYNLKGGYPIWGCLSGGKKMKCKSSKCKSSKCKSSKCKGKHRKTNKHKKNMKTKKHRKRHRY